MKHSNFYYNNIYLGTLYENGLFEYMINSNHSKYMSVENAIHQLERIRLVGLQDDFNYENYINTYNNFIFKDGYEFR